MLAEIRRVGLLSAGVTAGSLAAGLVLILGTLAAIGGGLAGDLAWLAEWAAVEDAPVSGPGETGSMLAVVAVVWLLLFALGAWLGGFLLGAFLAALYNVLAGMVGGLRLELADPRPRQPGERRGS
ncbi:hypothetical protein LNKW23_21850 [Paralimibaculum aggregatum]|uniref:DUF3566 domain-containing protein n=1 Tax=Paralimibaculum aggregatum TaxID=3036245 RepID=A0ABQ6LMQ5_9RHOB|nr:hypothetical protein [Limibaculum sp. NKW23]GMG82972.1 hypothetical protein LNKW23_21850 [Limibaculum sp. NKW23]